jgi:hypothetical protein
MYTSQYGTQLELVKDIILEREDEEYDFDQQGQGNEYREYGNFEPLREFVKKNSSDFVLLEDS